MQLASFPNGKARMLRAGRGKRLVRGYPASLNHLLVLIDFQPDSKVALDFASELAELFNSRLTLMQGGERLCPPGLERDQQAAGLDPSRRALLCLAWELRRRCPEVGLCLDAGHLPEQVWEAAACRDVDLIVLPQNLFGRFRPLVKGNGPDEVMEGAPCPVLLVGSAGTPGVERDIVAFLSKREPIA
jgi:nucleotide-binding universal stress UspA family protein